MNTNSMSAQHTPGPWKVFRIQSRSAPTFIVGRESANGREYLNTPTGFPRVFGSGERARAALAVWLLQQADKATGSAATIGG